MLNHTELQLTGELEKEKWQFTPSQHSRSGCPINAQGPLAKGHCRLLYSRREKFTARA